MYARTERSHSRFFYLFFLTIFFLAACAPGPTISTFTLSPTQISPGESATITWAVTDADTVSITPDIGIVELTGSISVSPTSTQTYTITATLGEATITKDITLIVGIPDDEDEAPPIKPPYNGDDSVGSIGGELRVGDDGSSNYSIAISIPPGINGMQPSANLNYSSSAGNGLAGLGWGISLASSISRCNKTDPDGFITDVVKVLASDDYCLDGKKLILESGTAGTNGAVYKTQENSQITITAIGTSGNGPDYFEITDSEGRKTHYGKANTSKLRHKDGSSVLQWDIFESFDLFSNNIRYIYNSNKAEGHFIEDIYYGHDLSKRIDLEYEDRPDHYIAAAANGLLISNTKRLKAINIHADDSLLEYYTLRYEYDASNYSTLKAIQKCNSDDVCLPEQSYDWSSSGITFDSIPALNTFIYGSTNGATVDISRLQVADFNGDGASDIYYVTGWGGTSRDRIHLSNRDGTFTSKDGLNTHVIDSVEGSKVDVSRFKYGDFNGDGKADIYYVNGWGYSATDSVYLSKGDGTFNRVNGINSFVYASLDAAPVDISRLLMADFDGDGRTDIYQINGWGGSARDYIYLSNGDGTYRRVNGLNTFVIDSVQYAPIDISRLKLGDFDGDGRTDIYLVSGWESTATDRIYLSNGDGTFRAVDGLRTFVKGTLTGAPVDISRFKLGDFNGDSRTDIYYVNGWGGSARDTIHLSKGDGSFDRIDGMSTFVIDNTEGALIDISRIILSDFNADGLTDVYRMHGWGNSQEDSIHLSSGNGTFRVVSGLTTFINDRFDSARVDMSRFKFGDFDGNGATDIYYMLGWGTSTQDSLKLNTAKLGLMEGINNEIGASSSITYESLVEYNAYSQSQGSTYPVFDIGRAIRVVSAIETENGIGENTNRTEYDYQGLRVHRGLGSLGFRSIQSTDMTTGTTNIKNFSQNWLLRTQGMVESTQTISADGTILAASYNLLDNKFLNPDGSRKAGTLENTHLPYIQATTSIQRDLDGSIINLTTMLHELDDKGWVVTDRTCVTAAETYSIASGIRNCDLMSAKAVDKTTIYDYYEESYAPAFSPLLKNKTTTVTIPDAPPFQSATETRVVEYEYYTNTGKVWKETIQPESDLWLAKTYAYHASGQLESTEVSGADIESRTTRIEYDSINRPWKKYNALDHMTEILYEDSRFSWLPTKEISPNQIAVDYEYNSWGEKVAQLNADGTWSESSKAWCADGTYCLSVSNETFYSISSSSNGPDTYIFFDKLGREVRRQGWGLKNSTMTAIYKTTSYNDRGLVDRAGHPYYEGDQNIYADTTIYDDLGRPRYITDAANQTSEIAYSGLTVVYTDPKLHTKTVIKNALGQQVEVKDNRNNSIHYRYDAFGNMVYMRDPDGNETKIGFNHRGFKTMLDDPDQGVWNYEYNALGELTTQTDAKNQVVRTQFDVLGRKKSVTDLYGTPQTKTSNWYYDDVNVSPTAIGKLTMVTNNDNYQQTIRYDELGRAYEKITTIDGATYKTTTNYDGFGRTKDTVYPTGYTVRNKYHPELGSLDRVINPATNYVFWQAEHTNARGQLEVSTLGGIITTSRRHYDDTGMVKSIVSSVTGGALLQDVEYQWDAVGNLDYYDDHYQRVYEDYVYDDLNRLNDVNSTTGTTFTRYNDLGNITSRSGVGSYDYDNIAVPAECGSDDHAAGPHAVRRISGAKSNYYCYDQNGNLVKDKDRVLKYTAFNKPYEISKGSTLVTFAYGPNRSRFKRVESKSGATTTTHYLGNYEKVVESSGSIKHKIMVGGNAQVIEEVSGGTTTTRISYFLTDHLGSITSVVNSLGVEQERMSFDAWGNRRLTNLDLISSPNEYKNPFTNRGFTGHEHVDSVGLIHMNGRVYDPVIGRFLSADPIIQAPGNLQSLNRYSYVMNNPLSITDPSGYSWIKKKWKQIRRVAIAAVAYYVCGGPCASTAYTYRYAKDKGLKHHDALDLSLKAGAMTAATQGIYLAAGGYLNAIQDAIIAKYGATAGSAIAIGTIKVATHSVIAGALADINGGKFSDGAFVGAFGKAYTVIGMNFFDFAEGGAESVYARIEQAVVAAAATAITGQDAGMQFAQSVFYALLAWRFNEHGDDYRKEVRSKLKELTARLRHALMMKRISEKNDAFIKNQDKALALYSELAESIIEMDSNRKAYRAAVQFKEDSFTAGSIFISGAGAIPAGAAIGFGFTLIQGASFLGGVSLGLYALWDQGNSHPLEGELAGVAVSRTIGGPLGGFMGATTSIVVGNR